MRVKGGQQWDEDDYYDEEADWDGEGDWEDEYDEQVVAKPAPKVRPGARRHREPRADHARVPLARCACRHVPCAADAPDSRR